MENLEDLIEKETKIRKGKRLKKWSISKNKEKMICRGGPTPPPRPFGMCLVYR